MLDIVISARNDDYGGADFHERLCAAATHNHRLLDAAGIAHRFVLVEWNPLPGRRPLLDVVRESLPWWHQGVTVDPAWHQASSTNPRLQFMEFFAKNAAIRRSDADLILTTNSDVFLSSELVATLTATHWNDRAVYRAVRVDVDRHSPWRDGGEATFADEQHQLRVNDLQPPDYGNSAGDFLLLTKQAWLDLGGFNERVRYAKIHKDGQFCIHARLRGYRFETLGCIYHIDHDGSYANAGAMRGSPDAPYGPEWDYRSGYSNARSWGLSAAVEDVAPNGQLRLRHPADAGPVLSIIHLVDGSIDAFADRGARAETIPAPVVNGLAPAINMALAQARGQVVVVTTNRHLTAFGGRDELIKTIEADGVPGLFVPRGHLRTHPRLGTLPCEAAPIGIRRDVIDLLVDVDENARAPLAAFWLLAADATTPAEIGPVRSGVDALPMPVPADMVLKTVLRRGGTADVALIAEAARMGATADALTALEAHVAALPGQRVAIAGPDWATALLIDAVTRTGRTLVGVFTHVVGEEGTWRWGSRLQSLSELGTTEADCVLTGRAIGPDAMPADATLHVFDSEAASDAPPAELDLLRAAQARDLAAGRRSAVLERLHVLDALEGPRGLAHWYDAAQLLERQGDAAAACWAFGRVLDGSADVALGDRAAFHIGRLLIDAGRLDEAVAPLKRVLMRTPHHRAADALLARCLGVAA